MSKDNHDYDELLHAHAQLQFGLRSCRELVADLRSKLVANGNEPNSDNDQDDEDEDQSAG